MNRYNRVYYVYIMSNPRRSVLYTGVTNDLMRRVHEHKEKLIQGFTRKYNIVDLVYYESTTDIHSAIAREKELKGWRREKKDTLIASLNPILRDLSGDI